MAAQKRKKQNEELRANRSRTETNGETSLSDHSALDNLLEKLRNGDSAGRRTRRRGHKHTPSKLIMETSATKEGITDETSDKAKELLARLKAGVLDAPDSSISPTARQPRSAGSRRNRLRMNDMSIPNSPLEESEFEFEPTSENQPSSAEWDSTASGMSISHSRSSSTSDALNEYMRARRQGSESAISSPQLPTQPEEAEPNDQES